MIADVVESTTKSLDQFEDQDIQRVLDQSIKNLIDDGQLDEAPITMAELATIKNYMLPLLRGIYSQRIKYPEREEN